MASPEKILVEFCLPVYNEENILKENTLKLLQFFKQQKYNFAWQIIILNNGSTDNSKLIGQELVNHQIKIIDYEESGKGRAIKQYGLVSRADWLFYMDIDLAVSLENINDLIKQLIINQYDIIMGSRLLPRSKVDRSLARGLSSKIYNFLSRIILDHKFTDLQCGFKAIRTEVFKKIIPLINDNNWFFDTELIYLAYRQNYRLKEIPVNWSENRYQQRKSKIRLFQDGFSFLIKLLKLKLRLVKLNKSLLNYEGKS